MSSEARINASQANGAKSLGPVTEEGKQASSRNSTRHGLLSQKIVLEGESQEEFDLLLASYLEEHQPQTPTERSLIESMAAARWRQERVWTLETAAMNNQIRRPRYVEGDDFPTQAYLAFHALANESPSFALLNRYEVRFERQFRAALAALQKLQAQRTRVASGKAAPEPDPETPFEDKRFKLYWADEDGNKTLAADSKPDPEPEPSSLGSFGIHPLSVLILLLSAFYQWAKALPATTRAWGSHLSAFSRNRPAARESQSTERSARSDNRRCIPLKIRPCAI